MQDIPNTNDLTSATDSMAQAVEAFTYDGDRDENSHKSGEPLRRSLVLGDEDDRDSGLEEKPLTEDVMWEGRIFNVNRLRVKLPDGREALRDVVRHPGAARHRCLEPSPQRRPHGRMEPQGLEHDHH